jgi:hypothetical protein
MYALSHLQLGEPDLVGNESLRVVTELADEIRDSRVGVGRDTVDCHALTPLVIAVHSGKLCSAAR